jgi:hypothetical protein
MWVERVPAQTPQGRGIPCLPYHHVTLSAPPESSGEILIAEITIPDIMTSIASENGQVFRKIGLKGYGYTSEVGKPRLPSGGFLVAVPEGAGITVEVLDTERVMRGNHRVFPVPEPFVEAGGASTGERFCLDAAAYSEDAYYPRDVASVGFYGYLREVRVAQISMFPVQYNPARGTLMIHRKIRLKLTVSDGTLIPVRCPPARAPSKQDPYDRIYRDLILNYRPGLCQRGIAPGLGGPRPGIRHLSGQACKILVETDGIYEITYQDLADGGLPVDVIDPRTIRLYNLGTELPVLLTGEEDGRLDEGDHLEFFGLANTSEYSQTNVYWLTWGGAYGERMSEIACSPGDTLATPEYFMESLHIEEDNRYYSNVYEGEGKDHWFWEQLIAPLSSTYPVTLPAVLGGSGTAEIRLGLRGKTSVPHRTSVSMNGTLVEDIHWSGMVEFERTMTFPDDHLIDGANTLEIECPGSAMDQIFLNWFEIDYRRRFEAHQDRIRFRGPAGNPCQLEIGGFSEPSVEIFRIGDATNTARLTGHSIAPEDGGYKVIFEADAGEHEFVAIGSAQKLKPAGIVPDVPSDLASPGNSADYVIISHEDFLDEIQTLRSLREAEGLEVAVVPVIDIYDEFSFGLFDPEAIKYFLEYAYWQWQRPSPTYVLLVGDASFDYRGNLPESRINYVPTHLFISQSDYLETSSDDWFACVAGDDILPDMLLGRLSAETPGEVRAIVDKIIGYETGLDQGDWRERALLVADNPDEGGNFEAYCDVLADNYFLPAGFEAEKVYVTEYGLGCRLKLIQELNEGCVACTYMGHGSLKQWAGERIFQTSDVTSLSNGAQLPLVIAFTCLNGFFHHATDDLCLAEAFARVPDKGSVACWCHSGLDYASCSGLIGNFLFESFLNRGNYVLGSAVQEAKIRYLATSPYFRDQAEMLILFGDPALEMGFPGRPDLLTGSIAFDPASPVAGAADTIIAEVYNAGREVASGIPVRFSCGHPESSATVLIADVTIQELGAGEHLEVRATWDSLPNPGTYEIFVEVDAASIITESCEWNNLAGDTLRVRFPVQAEDSIPPCLLVFIDHRLVGADFHNSDFVSPCPTVEAVFSDDETGIDPEAVDVILNGNHLDGFTLDTHKVGSDTVRLTCPMDSLADGTYDLRLCVSDCGANPNRTGTDITFVVETDLAMRNVTVYPSPSSSRTTFAYSLSRPADRVNVDIYSATGRLIVSFGSDACDRNLNATDWDCRDRDGIDLASGVYFYRIRARRGSQDTSTEGKLVVIR